MCLRVLGACLGVLGVFMKKRSSFFLVLRAVCLCVHQKKRYFFSSRFARYVFQCGAVLVQWVKRFFFFALRVVCLVCSQEKVFFFFALRAVCVSVCCSISATCCSVSAVSCSVTTVLVQC